MPDRSYETWRRLHRPPERTPEGVIVGERLFEQLVYASEKLVAVVNEVGSVEAHRLVPTFQQTFPVANEIYSEREDEDGA